MLTEPTLSEDRLCVVVGIVKTDEARQEAVVSVEKHAEDEHYYFKVADVEAVDLETGPLIKILQPLHERLLLLMLSLLNYLCFLEEVSWGGCVS